VIACIQLPYFAIQLTRNSDPATHKHPLLLTKQRGNRQTVVAVCQRSERNGAHPGLTLRKAQALCPDAQVLPIIQSQQQETVDFVVTLLTTYSNRLQIDPSSNEQTATIYADLGNIALHEGLNISQQMLRHLRDQTRLIARIGLSTGKFPATIQAQSIQPGWAALIPPGQERDFVARFPVQHLPLNKDTQRRLDLLGLHHIGQFANLPRVAVVEQFGAIGRLAHQLALGEDHRRIPLYEPPKTKTLIHPFTMPVQDRLILEAVLQQMAITLSTRLQNTGHCTSTLSLELSLEDGTSSEQDHHLRQPVTTAISLNRELLRLFDQMLPHTGVVKMTIRLLHLQPVVPVQLDLFGASIHQRDWKAAILGLVARHGEAVFQQATINNDHILPERRFWLEPVVAS
jgi:nucleotidyltransferase/DNA polymerase involved in DNA repair